MVNFIVGFVIAAPLVMSFITYRYPVFGTSFSRMAWPAFWWLVLACMVAFAGYYLAYQNNLQLNTIETTGKFTRDSVNALLDSTRIYSQKLDSLGFKYDARRKSWTTVDSMAAHYEEDRQVLIRIGRKTTAQDNSSKSATISLDRSAGSEVTVIPLKSDKYSLRYFYVNVGQKPVTDANPNGILLIKKNGKYFWGDWSRFSPEPDVKYYADQKWSWSISVSEKIKPFIGDTIYHYMKMNYKSDSKEKKFYEHLVRFDDWPNTALIFEPGKIERDSIKKIIESLTFPSRAIILN